MGNTYNVIEQGIIQCACGGKATLTSTAQVERIAGKKPLYLNDIIGAPVACPRSKNPCSKIVSNSMAGTESNVISTNEHFLLRTDGFKTDKGRGVVLIDPGQSTSRISAHPSIDRSKLPQADFETSVEQTREDVEDSARYIVYPFRSTKDNDLKNVYKPLRACKEFTATTSAFFKGEDTPEAIKEQLFFATDSYIYVKLANNQIDEYKVISNGTINAQPLSQTFYLDEGGVRRRFIPLLGDESVAFYYLNIRLSTDQAQRAAALKNFTPLILTPNEPKTSPKSETFYIKSADEIEGSFIFESQVKNAKKYDPIEEYEQKKAQAKKEGKSTVFKLYPLDIALELKDPIGELEDMIEYQQTHYNINYARNYEAFERIKKKNLYLYDVANKIDYFYIDKEEKERMQASRKKLQTLYKQMVQALFSNETLSGILPKPNRYYSRDVSHIVDTSYDIAVMFKQEVEAVAKDFFKSLAYLSKANALFINQSVYARNYTPRQESDNKTDDRKFIVYKDNVAPYETLAYLVFAVYFGGEYERHLERAGVQSLKEEFYYALKNAPMLPLIDQAQQSRIQKLIDTQTSSYKAIIDEKIDLLGEFESIDAVQKTLAYTQKIPTKLFKALVADEALSHDTTLTPPKSFTKEILKLLNKEVQEIVKTLQSKEISTNAYSNTHYVQRMLNLFLLLCANHTKSDVLANEYSPFNAKLHYIIDFLKQVLKQKDVLDETSFLQIYEDEVYAYYIDTINAYLMHALIQTKGNEDKQRNTNTKNFLESFETDTIRVKENLQDICDFNFEKSLKTKKKAAKLYEQLKQINGINEKVHKVFEEVGEDQQANERSRKINQDSSRDYQKTKSLHKHYTTLTKGFSTIFAASNIALTLSDPKRVKTPDIFALATDSATLHKSLSEVLPKYAHGIKEGLQKIVAKETLLKLSNYKLMSKVGIVGIAVTTVYEVKKLDESDVDGQAALIGKNLLMVGLLLVPGGGWIAALGILALEVAWQMYLKDIFIDSAIETYLFHSLLFDRSDYKNAQYYIDSMLAIKEDKEIYNYNAHYLSQVVNKKLGFDSLQELQEYVASLDEQTATAAIEFETKKLLSVLREYQIEVHGDILTLKKGFDTIFYKTKLTIKQEFLNDIESIYIKDGVQRYALFEKANEQEQIGYTLESIDIDTIKNYSYDKTLIKQEAQKEKALYIFLNDGVTLKYTITYALDEKPMTNHGIMNYYFLKINPPKLTPLNQNDKEWIESIKENDANTM